MGDLISRSAMIEALEEYVEYDNFDFHQEIPMIHLSFEQLEDIICNQPTVEAIPKEKLDEIVERLEEASFVVEVDYDFDEYDDDSVESVFLNEAIEIVKEVGGMDG